MAAARHHRDDQARVEPVLFLALVEHELERAGADGEQGQPPVINRDALALEIVRVVHPEPREKHRDDADRDVDVEHPPPGPVVRQPAAEHRPQNGRDDNAEAPEAHGLAALMRRKGFEQHGLRQRLHDAAGQALHDSEDDQHRQVRRHAAQGRREREGRDREDEQAFSAEERGQPSRHRQHDGVGGDVGRQHPCRLFHRGRQTAGDMRQRHVHHGRVERDHERAAHHGDGGQPRADRRRL